MGTGTVKYKSLYVTEESVTKIGFYCCCGLKTPHRRSVWLSAVCVMMEM